MNGFVMGGGGVANPVQVTHYKQGQMSRLTSPCRPVSWKKESTGIAEDRSWKEGAR